MIEDIEVPVLVAVAPLVGEVILPAPEGNAVENNEPAEHVVPRNMRRRRLFVETEAEKRARLDA